MTPLTLGELWAWPVMLRIGLLESVRRMALRAKQDVLDARRADEQVQRFRSVPAATRSCGVSSQNSLRIRPT